MLKKLILALLCIIPTTTFMVPENNTPYKWLSQSCRLERLKELSLDDRKSIMKLTSERRTIQLFASIPNYTPEVIATLGSRLRYMIPLLRKNNVLALYESEALSGQTLAAIADDFVQLGDDLELLHRQNR